MLEFLKPTINVVPMKVEYIVDGIPASRKETEEFLKSSFNVIPEDTTYSSGMITENVFIYTKNKKMNIIDENGNEVPENIPVRHTLGIHLTNYNDDVIMYFFGSNSDIKNYQIFLYSLLEDPESNDEKDIRFDRLDYVHSDDIVFSKFEMECETIKKITVKPIEKGSINKVDISVRTNSGDTIDKVDIADIDIIDGDIKRLSGMYKVNLPKLSDFIVEVNLKTNSEFSIKLKKDLREEMNYDILISIVEDILNKFYIKEN